MTDNPITGEARVTLPGGATLRIVFDWEALAAIQANFGKDETFDLQDMKTLTRIAAIGLQRHHPEISEKTLADMSPPVVPMIEACRAAFHYAHFGPDPAPTESAAAKNAAKKNKMAVAISFLKRFQSPSVPA